MRSMLTNYRTEQNEVSLGMVMVMRLMKALYTTINLWKKVKLLPAYKVFSHENTPNQRISWGVCVVVPGVVGRRVLCFRFPHSKFALLTNYRWKPSTPVTPLLAGQGSVTSFWTSDEHGHNVYISTTPMNLSSNQWARSALFILH